MHADMAATEAAGMPTWFKSAKPAMPDWSLPTPASLPRDPCHRKAVCGHVVPGHSARVGARTDHLARVLCRRKGHGGHSGDLPLRSVVYDHSTRVEGSIAATVPASTGLQTQHRRLGAPVVCPHP